MTCRTYMRSFHFLNFLLQRFVKRSSESEKDKMKRKVIKRLLSRFS